MKTLPAHHDQLHLREALKYVRSRRTAVDCGAHVGHWTRVLAKSFQRVVAFEPNPPHVEKLRTIPGVEVHHTAVGAAVSRGVLVPGHQNDGQWHIQPGDGVDVQPLDAFALTDVDFLKLDVEGFELFALQGAEVLVTTWRPVVLIEENGLCQRYDITPGAAGEWLREHGYSRAARLNKDEIWVAA